MEEKFTSLPNYKFNWRGFMALVLGAIIPSAFIGVFNVLAMILISENWQYEDAFLIISNTVMWAGAIFAFDYFICRPQTKKPLNFNFSTKNFTTYLLVFPLMFGMMLIAEFVAGKIPVTGPFFGKMHETFSKLMEQMSKDISVMILLAVIMAPIFEEIVFRGIVQKGLINKGVKPMNAIWISALAFGIVHFNPWQFVGAVLLGFVLGIVYEKTKSLLLPILLHAFNNGISTLLIFYGDTESFAEYFKISEYILLMVGIIIFIIFYLLFTKKYRVHYAEN